MIKRKNEINTTRKQGNSVYLAITGFAEVGEHFKIKKIDDRNIRLTKIDME